jgi:UV DNA damage endonuclease
MVEARGPRLGLCCLFRDAPIKFRTTTAAAMLRLEPAARCARLAELALENARALVAAVEWCAGHGIGAFRIVSQILPVKTHPGCGYRVDDLPGGETIAAEFRRAGEAARRLDVRLSFHPDQFVVLNSPRPDVVAKSIEELEYQAEVAEWVGADVVNIHAGGAYGDKAKAIDELRRTIEGLSDRVRTRLTLENDDVTYTPADLLPLCRADGVPLCYDVHHHRCLADGLSIEEATEAARETWPREIGPREIGPREKGPREKGLREKGLRETGPRETGPRDIRPREPLFHLSSPIDGWAGRDPKRHHDFIDPADFPAVWRGMEITVDVEAKAKEAAVLRLAKDLARGDAASAVVPATRG